MSTVPIRYSRRVRPGRLLPLAAGAAVIACVLTAAARSPAQARPVSGTAGYLNGVSTVSASDAWAVGDPASAPGPLIMHWNGSAWSTVPSHGAPASSGLSAVSMSSGTNGWAVGWYAGSNGGQTTLTMHWNGTRWTRVPSPNPMAGGNLLTGVAAVSPTDAWAVGWGYSQTVNGATVILHWNGARWTRVPSPNPIHLPGGDALLAVSASSASDAWAVGYNGLTLHWNGARWAAVPSPGDSTLNAVDDVSRTDVWSAGVDGGNTKTVALRWNGAHWARASSPSPGSGPPDSVPAVNQLTGVSAVSGSQALSVGSYTTKTGTAPLALRWNGIIWQRVPAPGGRALSILAAVSMTSATDAWAVGGNQATGKVLILHWNGTRWTRF